MSLYLNSLVMLYLLVEACLLSQKPVSTFVRHALEYNKIDQNLYWVLGELANSDTNVHLLF